MRVCEDLTEISITGYFGKEQAENFLKVLLEATHCNSHPKRIQIWIRLSTGFYDNEKDWSIVETINSSGVGSVKELMFWVVDPDYQCGPDWSYLTNTVSIDTVTMLRGTNDMPRYCFFCSIKAKCLKFGPEYEFFWMNEHPEWLDKFEKLVLALNVTTNFSEWFTGQDNPYTIRLWARRRSGS